MAQDLPDPASEGDAAPSAQPLIVADAGAVAYAVAGRPAKPKRARRTSGARVSQADAAADEPTGLRAAERLAVRIGERIAERGGERVDDEPAFVLHSWPYRETSLVIDVLSRRYGRLALVAKGARRPRSEIRGMLQAFRPLTLSWSGRGEVKTLVRANWVGGMPALDGDALMSGFYANELLVKLTARDDPHPAIFDAYLELIAALSHHQPAAPPLRRFERVLITEIGYAHPFDRDGQDHPVLAEHRYRVPARHAPERVDDDQLSLMPEIERSHLLNGRSLLAISRDDYADADVARDAKFLMRRLIGDLLDGQALSTRQLLMDLPRR